MILTATEACVMTIKEFWKTNTGQPCRRTNYLYLNSLFTMKVHYKVYALILRKKII